MSLSRRSIGAVATFALLAAVSASEQAPLARPSASKNPLTDEFGQFVREALDEWKVPGLSIAVIDGDDVYAEGYGIATFPDTPAKPETVWYGASTTKAFTSATLAHLIDSGNYSELSDGWQTTLASIMRDDFVLEDEWMTNHVTLEDAASHRTGMTRHDMSSQKEINGKQASVGDVVRNLRNLHIVLKPRYTFSYCNLMYTTLSHAVETITGKWLGEAMRENIWEPLGMSSTYLHVKDANKGPNHIATGYYWDSKEEEFKEVRSMPLVEVSGAGAIMSNVLDYSKWVQCLLSESAPFSKRTHQDIKTPRMLDALPKGPMDISMYTLGWSRGAYRGTPFYTHDGGLHAYGTNVIWIPSINFGVVAFANTALTSNVVEEILTWRLVDEKLGVPAEDRFDASVRWHEFMDKIIRGVDEAVPKLFPEIPDPPLAPTLNTSELVGTYYDAGYKNITLHEEQSPDNPEETLLVAVRADMTWEDKLTLHHVSGDYWVILHQMMGIDMMMNANWMRAEFNAGADGKPSGLKVEMHGLLGGLDEGSVLFRKIA